MSERVRGEALWSWIVRAGCFGVFVYAALFRGGEASFGIAFLAISGAVFPIREFAAFLRSWRGQKSDS